MSDSETVQDLREQVEDIEERLTALEERFEAGDAPRKGRDLRTLVKEFEPSTHVERALVIGYHLERNEGHENFTIDEIKRGYRDAKLKEPANMSDVLGSAGEQGLMRRDGEENGLQLWMLTLDGEQRVEEVVGA